MSPLKIPLCAYVEENVPIEESPEPLNKTENAPFKDPKLGCVQCQIEPYEQCENVPQKTCEMVEDKNCNPCPPMPKSRAIALDITDQNEVCFRTFAF